MPTKAFAVIAGVGSGTGTSLAHRFAKTYPVALLARKPESYEGLVQEINNSGGKAVGVSADVSSEDSVKAAFKTEQDLNWEIWTTILMICRSMLHCNWYDRDVESREEGSRHMLCSNMRLHRR